MRFYIKNYTSTDPTNPIIRGKVFHQKYENKDGLMFTFNANFENAFVKNTLNYIYINGAKKTQYFSGDFSGEKEDVDIIFSFITNTEKAQANFIFHDGSKKMDEIFILKKDNFTCQIFIPNSATNLNKEQTIGIAFGYNGDELKDISIQHCFLFGNPIIKNNQYGYGRLYGDNSCFGASHNINPFNISWDNISLDYTTYDGTGIIGYPSAGGYSFKIAKNIKDDHGIYILTKTYHDWEYTHFYMRMSYNRHIYIDTNAEEYNHDEEGYKFIYNFKTEGNHWLKRYIPKNSSEPFPSDTLSELDELLMKGVKFYSKGNDYNIYIPYDYLAKINPNFTKNSKIGFMFNINQNGNNPYSWKNWTIPLKNPTGYNETMYFENRNSYLHLDQNLNIIPYN